MVARTDKPPRETRANPDAVPDLPAFTREGSARRMARCLEDADKRLDPLRKMRRMFATAYAGPYYGQQVHGDADPQGRVTLNLLFSMVSTLLPSLEITPGAEVTAREFDLEWFAEITKAAVNRILEEAQAERPLSHAILDALFGWGILKTGLSLQPAGKIEDPQGWVHDRDIPYIEPVDLDDYLCDLQPRRAEEMAFEGNRFDVPYTWAMDSPIFGPRAKAQMERSFKVQQAGQRNRTQELGSGKRVADSEMTFVDKLGLIELWLPYSNESALVVDDLEGITGWLIRRPYEGPEGGPFTRLSFHDVPGNIAPLPKIATVYDLHLLLNELARKIARQAQREKSLLLYDEQVAEEAERIKSAKDGALVGVANVQRYSAVTFGGADAKNYESVQFFRDFFQSVAGNPDLIGGTAARSKTLGQDAMLMSSIGLMLGHMRKRVVAAGGELVHKCAWYVWTDPQTSHRLKIPVAGLDIPATWTPEYREGDFLDYRFFCRAYELRNDDPAQRYQALVGLFKEVILPLATLGQATGDIFDAPEMFRLMAEQLQLPETQRFWHKGPPVQGPAAAPAQPPGQEGMNVSVRGPQQRQPQAQAAPQEAMQLVGAGT